MQPALAPRISPSLNAMSATQVSIRHPLLLLMHPSVAHQTQVEVQEHDQRRDARDRSAACSLPVLLSAGLSHILHSAPCLFVPTSVYEGPIRSASLPIPNQLTLTFLSNRTTFLPTVVSSQSSWTHCPALHLALLLHSRTHEPSLSPQSTFGLWLGWPPVACRIRTVTLYYRSVYVTHYASYCMLSLPPRSIYIYYTMPPPALLYTTDDPVALLNTFSLLTVHINHLPQT
jgi:hypothetical protein